MRDVRPDVRTDVCSDVRSDLCSDVRAYVRGLYRRLPVTRLPVTWEAQAGGGNRERLLTVTRPPVGMWR
jgi:hypothetical protein